MNKEESKVAKVTATVRIVSTIQGKPLTQAEVYHCNVPVLKNDSANYNATIVKALCNTALRESFVNTFYERLRKDVKLKKEIGGVRWSVDVLDYNYTFE